MAVPRMAKCILLVGKTLVSFRPAYACSLVLLYYFQVCPNQDRSFGHRRMFPTDKLSSVP